MRLILVEIVFVLVQLLSGYSLFSGIDVDDIALGKQEPPEGVEHIQLEG